MSELERRNEPSRREHLDGAKRRAIRELEAGNLREAFASMTSDLSKHPETIGHPGVSLGLQLWMGGFLQSSAEMRRWIEGFN